MSVTIANPSAELPGFDGEIVPISTSLPGLSSSGTVASPYTTPPSPSSPPLTTGTPAEPGSAGQAQTEQDLSKDAGTAATFFECLIVPTSDCLVRLVTLALGLAFIIAGIFSFNKTRELIVSGTKAAAATAAVAA